MRRYIWPCIRPLLQRGRTLSWLTQGPHAGSRRSRPAHLHSEAFRYHNRCTPSYNCLKLQPCFSTLYFHVVCLPYHSVACYEAIHPASTSSKLALAMTELAVYDNDPTIYLFTSLTAGSSHIITATSRIETILRANKIPFKGVDTATDELAKKLFQRRASGKKLPLIVKEGYVLGVSIGHLSLHNQMTDAQHRVLQKSKNGTNTTSSAKP
jgi:hypothetical protein